ncbi:His Kinase A (phospho-acceptor) domain-containing protein [Stigmatella aurantiaca]|uniref:histidine kinase n=1 Tax=Stigmatella aurantiaca TaxID=41 RepID=A0A1H7WTJ1_STIAU|nr:HAMP domain-containing sensor histidine kinase [Stigmatella aurantiaca]SEM24852.1 His Kinase A (phospho-acceptor) domain-containing protein [Stigmatella aurantiaca]
MWRKRLPTLMALGIGLVVLTAGLLFLHGIFLREREGGLRALEDQRRALEQYARQALTDSLRRALEEARPRIEQAEADPLLMDTEVVLFRAGQQRLPRTAAPRGDDATPARTLHAALEAQGPRALASREAPDSAWAERLRLMDRFLVAQRAGRRPDIEHAFREWLTHRTSFVLPVVKETTGALWLLERFQAEGQPDPALMQALLREGLQGRSGSRLEGLQRLLLERQESFGRSDFAFLRERVARLAERTHVAFADFNARVDAGPGARVALALPLEAPQLQAEGWYVEPSGPEGARGVRIRLGGLVEAVRQEMRERGLLQEDDALTVSQTDRPLPVPRLAVSLASPRMAGAASALESGYRLKAVLLAWSGALVLALTGLAVLAHERKLRFLALRSEFISTVSHELRTPLSAIRVMAETLERRVGGTPGAGNYPSRIISEADALGRLVENILTYNRLEKGRWEARRERVPLEDLVQRTVEDTARLHSTAVDLQTVGLSGIALPGDPELLRMLFSNLVSNACRYTTRSPVVLRVEARQEGATVVRVGDNGVGIPPESWEAVFEDFRRLRQEGLPARGGSGLGLAICRRILSLHGGTVRIATSGPEGTTFELTFPSA